MDKECNVLVLSVASWNTKTGMNTWPTLLEGHNPDHVAQICFREETPDHPICNNYFIFSERKILKSVFHRKIKTGTVAARGELSAELERDLIERKAQYAQMRRHRNTFTLFAREIVWKLGRWKTPELNDFVRTFQPDVILYAMEGYIYFNRICRYVKKISKASSVGFFTDDNFTYRKNPGFLPKVFRFFQRQSLKKLAKKTDAFFAISDKTKREADAFFNIDCTVLTKPMPRLPEVSDFPLVFPLQMLYTGNLGIGRDRTLLRVAEVVQKINKEEPKFKIAVYTQTDLPEETKAAFSPDVIEFFNAIPQEEILQKQRSADILLFLEAMEGKNARAARLSFSTKITDYFSAGKCIFAVGCRDTAPMEYFETNHCAVTAATDEEILCALEEIAANPEAIRIYAAAARDCGLRNHQKEKILEIFNRIVEQVAEKK